MRGGIFTPRWNPYNGGLRKRGMEEIEIRKEPVGNGRSSGTTRDERTAHGSHSNFLARVWVIREQIYTHHLPLPFSRTARPARTLPLLASVTRFVIRIVVLEVIIVLFVVIPVHRGRFLRFRCLGLRRGGNIHRSYGRTRVEQTAGTEPFTVRNGVKGWDQTPQVVWRVALNGTAGERHAPGTIGTNGTRTLSHSKGESSSPLSWAQTIHSCGVSRSTGCLGRSENLSFGRARKKVVF